MRFVTNCIFRVWVILSYVGMSKILIGSGLGDGLDLVRFQKVASNISYVHKHLVWMGSFARYPKRSELKET